MFGVGLVWSGLPVLQHIEPLPRTMIRVSSPDSYRSTALVLMGLDRTLGRQSRTKRRALTAVHVGNSKPPRVVWFILIQSYEAFLTLL